LLNNKNELIGLCKDREDMVNQSRLVDERTVAGNWTRKLGKLGNSRESEVKSGKWV
jgi:hypothetical protein